MAGKQEKVKKSLYLHKPLAERLEAVAREKGISVNALVKLACDDYLKNTYGK